MIEQLKAACALIRAPNSQGTGYLVAPRLVATCEHVVRWAETHVEVAFGARSLQGRLIKSDKDTDCALIELPEPLEGVTPLSLAGSCAERAEWRGFGFPGIGKGAGIPLFGHVLDPDSTTDGGKPALTLYSDMVAAGMAEKINGYSGSPVLVDGLVVGHVSKVLSSVETPGRPGLGLIYAARSAGVLALMGEEPAVALVAPPRVRLVGDDVPPLAAGQHHVFIRFAFADREWARALAARLEGVGMLLFLAEQGAHPGEELQQKQAAALASSRAAVVLLSQGWLSSPWCQQEAVLLRQRAETHPDFRLVPLRLDDAQPPPGWQGSAFDFRHQGTPVGSGLEAVIYALLGKPAPAPETAEAQINRAMTKAVDAALPGFKLAARQNPGRLRAALHDWRHAGLPMSAVSVLSAQELISFSHFQEALEILSDAPSSLRARQLRALALAKLNRLDEAIELLRQLREEGQSDPETLGLLGGRFKDKWRNSGDAAYLLAAYETYLDSYERIGDAFSGINVAALAIQLPEPERDTSRRIAQQVTDALRTRPEQKLDHFEVATLAEGALLLGDVATARAWYRKAVARAPEKLQDIAVMRRQARLNLKALGLDEHLVDASLPVPKVTVFSGHMVDAPGRTPARFPESRVAAVRREIEKRLTSLGKVYGFCSGARGADVLFLETLLAREGHAEVFLPFAIEDFKRSSVGGAWDARIDRVLQDKNVVLHAPTEPAPPEPEQAAAFARCNQRIIEAARQKARTLDEVPVLLAVWDEEPGAEGGTASVVQAWRDEGLPVELIPLASL